MRLLDLCCKAGGSAKGYELAGFTEIIGVDIEPQPHYPYTFIQADAMHFSTAGFDLIHASVPCQGYGWTNHIITSSGREYPMLIEGMRRKLQAQAIPWVMENVPGAPLIDPVILCGTGFGRQIRRHRLFETSFPVGIAPACFHRDLVDIGVYAGKVTILGSHAAAYVAGSGRTHYRPQTSVKARAMREMEINWMTMAEMSEAVLPCQTEWIGREFLRIPDAAVGRRKS